MDEAKRAAREVATGVKRTVRAVDGTDPKDHVANAGDEVRKDLGNFGDDVRRAGRRARVDSIDPESPG